MTKFGPFSGHFEQMARILASGQNSGLIGALVQGQGQDAAQIAKHDSYIAYTLPKCDFNFLNIPRDCSVGPVSSLVKIRTNDRKKQEI